MNRVRPSCFVELIGRVFSEMPLGISRLLNGTDFAIGLSPSWINLHHSKSSEDGRSYASTSHAVWPMHQKHLPMAQRNATVVLNDGDEFDRLLILHELGHILDERLDFGSPKPIAISDYAKTSDVEAFATSFQAFLTPLGEGKFNYPTYGDLWESDSRMLNFFRSL